MSKLTKQSSRIPMVEPQSGMITREWYRYITDSFARMGADDAPTNAELGEMIARTVYFVTFLNAAKGDVLQAFSAAFAECASRIDSGEYSRVTLDLGNADIGIPSPGLVIPASAKNVTMRSGRLYAIEGDWTEDNKADLDHLIEYEKVSEQGKLWSHRKPLVTVSSGNTGFRLEDVDIDGKGEAPVRQSAGVRVKGRTADRKWIGGKVENCETYGGYIGSSKKNDGAIDVEGVEFKPNGRDSRYDRTSYGLIVSGNDMHVRNIVADNCHACLLVTSSGATTFFTGCDFFNGASFDIEGFQHRSIEYHGNSATFRSDRHGNGIVHLYSHDVFFFPTKYGITAGSGEDPPESYFYCYPTKPDDDLQGFGLYASETPIDLATEIVWLGFDPGDGINTWAVDVVALAQHKGYLTTMPSGKYTFLQVSATDKGPTIAGGMDGIFMLFSDRTTTKEPRIGAVGNDLIVKIEDEEQLRTTVTGSAHTIGPATTSLNNNQWTARRNGTSGIEFKVKGNDGVTHEYSLPLTNEGYDDPIIDVSRWPYFMDEAAADNTDLLNTVFADAEALADDLGAVTVYLPGLYNTQGDHIITDRISIDVPNITVHGLNRITGKVGPLLTSTPKAASSSGIRQNQKIRLKMDGGLVGITKLTGTVTAGSDVITGVPAASVTAAVVGHLAEGVGIPDGATIIAKPSSTSLQISAVADQNNTNKTKIITREAVTLTATATSGSNVLTLTDTTGIKQYMRMTGTNLETDGDDLSQWSRVMDFVTNTSVTMDRAATASGSFSCTFYVYPECFLAVEVNQAPSYDPSKEYGAISFYARVTNSGGDAACFRPGRDQVHVMPESKADLGYGFGYRMTACNDSYFKRANSIAHWKACISIAGQATPRFEGEAGDPYMTDKYGAVEFKSMKECTLLDCDINGILKITGKSGETNPVITVNSCNFKFHPSDMNPGGTTNAYIQGGNGARINVIGGGFKWTDGATLGRPDYLFYSAGGATCSMVGVNFFTDTSNPDCAFDVGLCNDMSKLNVQYIDNDTGRLMQGEYTWTPTVTCQTVGDLTVAYTLQSGFAWITNSMAYIRAVVQYTPTFTTASGAIKILGCPVVPRGSTGDWPMQVSVDSTALDWGTFTQLFAQMKSSGFINIRGQGDNQAQAQLTMANTPTGQPQSLDIFGSFPI